MSSQKNDSGGSIAPKERVNIKFTPKTGNQTAEVELPLNLLVTGNLTGGIDTTPLDERQPVAISRNNFNAVLEQSGIGREFTVPSALSETPDARMNVNLKVKSLADLSPDNIASGAGNEENARAARGAGGAQGADGQHARLPCPT